ncbi:hypothetical protein FS837_011953 [Tulasnella sp. UAMH 9824]|nr:hypothetical protein FS837_011953 [Tulasnella sp. UAMH 9824]
MTSNAVLSDPVLQGAFQSIGQHYQKLIDDLTKKNSTLEDENRYVNDQMVALQDQVEKLTRELHDCNEELANARSHEAPPTTNYDAELMQKLLAASSQIIHAKDEVRSLDQQNRLLEGERKESRAALEASKRDAEEARQKVEEVEAQLTAAQREITQVKSSQTALQERLEEERKAYERSAKNKDKVIKELEDRITVLEKEAERSAVAEKENLARSPLQENNALPSQEVPPAASSSKPTFEGRYKQLRKQFELLESQYDSLRQTHVAEIEKFEATRARWAKYKTSILEGVAKIPGSGSSTKKPKLGVSTFLPATGSPLPRSSRPAEEAINTPNTSVRHSARASRIQDVVDKINEADAFDEAEGLNRPYRPRISALQLQMDPVSSPVRTTALAHAVEPATSPLNVAPASRTEVERSSPVFPRQGDAMDLSEHCPQRAGSPAETESEPGLSQSPFARLQLFEDDHIDIVPSDRPRSLRDAARPLHERSPTAGRNDRENGADTEMERVEMVGAVTSPVSRMRVEEEEVSFLRTIHKRAQTSGPPSTSTPSNQPPRFSALEAAFFIKQEPIDDDIEDPDVTVVNPEVSFTPGPKRKSLQSEKSRADIRAKLFGSKKVVTPRPGRLTPAAAESGTPRAAEASVLGKRKVLEVDTPGAGPSRPQSAETSASKRSRDSEMPPPSEPRRGYDQYKGRGRYAQGARPEAQQPINAIFEIDRSRNGGLDFQYDAVVRNREERRQMEATDCECCRDYYEVVGHLPQQRNGPQWRSPTPSLARSPKKRRCAVHEGQVGSGGSPLKRANSDPMRSPTKRKRMDQQDTEQAQQHRQNISRHRQNWARQTTPPDYWDIGFPTTQQIVSINQRAEENYAAKRAHIVQEANLLIPFVQGEERSERPAATEAIWSKPHCGSNSVHPMTSTTYTLPPADNHNIDPQSLDSIWPWMSQLFDFRFFAPSTTSDGKEVYPRATVNHKTITYDFVFKWTTTSGANLPYEALYEKLETYLGDVSRRMYEQQILPAAQNQALVDAYLSAWKRYDYCTNATDKELNYYNRHFIKRREDEGQGAKGVDPVKWGFPETFTVKEDAENAAKAAADEGVCPIRALGLRKWRREVVEKVKEQVVGVLKEVEDGDEKKKLAGQVKISFLATGNDPTSDIMVKLRELSGEEVATAAATPDIDPDALLPPQAQLPPTIPITFQQICTGKTYFQSVLIELEKREDSVLQALYDQVNTFNQKNRGGNSVPPTVQDMSTKPFYPHLSLYYGDPPMEVKEEIIGALEVEGVISILGPPTVGGVEGGFHVTEIWVVRTEGPVEQWEVLKKVKLEGMEHSPQEV